MNVENVMTRAPKTCSTTDMLHRAAQIMWDNDFGSVPVVDGNGRLAGILTDRDACMAGLTQGRALHEIPVESAMSKLLYTLAPHDPIQNALAIMHERQVRRMPVVDGRGTLVGILSLADIVCASVEGRIGRHTKQDSVLSAVHAVSKPRSAAKEPEGASARSKDTLFPAERGALPKMPAGEDRKRSKSSKRR
jgi:CBS domain-containing protein